jgi:hypothetical protein
MSTPENHLESLEKQYQDRLDANRLRQQVLQEGPSPASATAWTELLKAEQTVRDSDAYDPQGSDIVVDSSKKTSMLGAQTTGIEVKVYLRMSQVPTSIYHLINQDEHPLVSCHVRNTDNSKIRRLRVTSFIEGYSAKATTTVELEKLASFEFNHLPTLFPHKVRAVTELTRATLNILVENLDGGIELHSTRPIWLLARTTAVTAIRDPRSRLLQDLSPYLGAFVTPNAPKVISFLREAVELHPEKKFVGYQLGKAEVLRQVKTLYDALQQKAGITYVNSVISFNPGDGSEVHQRVRLPSESLNDKQANCIDGVVLFASLLESISLNPALVIVPGHALVAWEEAPGSGEWRHVETTTIGSLSFEDSCETADRTVRDLTGLADETGGSRLRRWPVRDLRTGNWSKKETRTVEYLITPME